MKGTISFMPKPDPAITIVMPLSMARKVVEVLEEASSGYLEGSSRGKLLKPVADTAKDHFQAHYDMIWPVERKRPLKLASAGRR